MDIVSRLMAGIKVNEATGCHEWQKCRNRYGYGKLQFNGTVSTAHRVAYQVLKGELPKGMSVCHQNAICCRQHAIRTGKSIQSWAGDCLGNREKQNLANGVDWELTQGDEGMASPISDQTITNATLATATALTVPAGTRYAVVQAYGQNFNYRTDGSTPTTGATGDGQKLYATGSLTVTAGLASILFIREADTANSKLVVEYFGGHV